MKKGTKIAEHLNVFNTLIFQLSDMEVKFQEEDKAITLLCSMPESWDHFFTSISLKLCIRSHSSQRSVKRKRGENKGLFLV